MKKFLIYSSLIFMSISAQAFTTAPVATKAGISKIAEVQALPTELQNLNVADFLNLTPAKYTEMTGKKLGVANTLKLKAAQEVLKNNYRGSAPLEKGLYIILSIFIPWLAMGLNDDWKGTKWVWGIIPCIGFIIALTRIKEFYR